ncbi:glycosyltransferase family 4 protein [Vibrio splendidus]
MTYKVVYILDYTMSVKGGAQLSTLNTAIEITKKFGVETYIIAPKSTERLLHSDGVKVIELETCTNRIPVPHINPINFAKTANEIREIVKKISPEIVHSQMPGAFILAGLVPNCKRIHTDRGLYSGYSALSKLAFMLLQWRFNKLILTTKFNYNKWPWPEKKKEVIYNSISSAFLEYKENEERKNSNILRVGFSGRYTFVKNWPLIKDIIESLVDKKIPIEVKIAISVNRNSKEESLSYENFKYSLLQIKNDITINEELNQNEMASFYSGIDVFIIPSVFESFGKVAVEAMARHCCVLSSNVGGLPEVIGNNSYVMDLDKNSYINKLIELIENPDELENAKKFFFYRYNKEFSQDNNTNLHHDLYSEIKKN